MTTPTPAGAAELRRFEAPAGVVVARVDGAVVRATGIRYARAARFAPPTPEPASPTPVDATRWSPACPQLPLLVVEALIGDGQERLDVDEDCQHLSLTLPAAAPARPLPVMVWIHGGSYQGGAGDSAAYDPRSLVEEQDVVVVAVTYRLGLFGFLGDPGGGGGADGGAGRPANLGLLDVLEALRWVRTNAAAFGGDPERITVFGQSAGGDAVAHLMAARGAEGLFRRAIIQSAPLGISRGRGAMTAAMRRAAGAVGAGSTTAEVLAVQPAVVAAARRHGLTGAMPFGTEYGHDPLPPEAEVEEVWRARAPSHDVLIGSTTEEVTLFLPQQGPVARFLDLPLVGAAVRGALVATMTRRIYGAPARRFARRHARGGGRAHLYSLTWAPAGPRFGATHAIDLPLLFGDERTWRDARILDGADRALVAARGREVRAVWARFARTGDLGESGGVDGVLSHRRVGPRRGGPRWTGVRWTGARWTGVRGGPPRRWWGSISRP